MNDRTYTTTYDDAYPNGCAVKLCVAQFEVVVTASDGEMESTQTVKLLVEDRNRPPFFKVPA